MSYKWTITLLTLTTALVSSAVPRAKADEWDKRTVVTLNAPVEVPGKVLAAGKYVFKLANNDSDRQVVQIFTEDETQVLATILAVPAYRFEPNSETVITLEERPGNSPEAIRKWFYPGDQYGVEFIYSR